MRASWIVAVFLLALGIGSLSPAVAEESLVEASGCFKCHSVEEAVVGPAFRDVADRYRGDAEARSRLIETVRLGGKGHWTEITHGVPMPSHMRRLEREEIERLVDWVLSLEPSTDGPQPDAPEDSGR